MKILIIEDELKAATYLAKGLSENGFVVDTAQDGIEGLHLAQSGDYDLLVLDVMLPGKNGWVVLAELRQAGNKLPVIFLTSRDAVEDRVKGLEAGADDYLAKPFAFSELLARVRSLLRRGPIHSHETLQIADLEIDPIRHKAQRAGQKLDLTPKEFALLYFMASRAGDTLSRTLLAEKVWDLNFDSNTNVVDVHIRRLRAKMDDPYEKKLIQTVRGVGYVLEDQG